MDEPVLDERKGCNKELHRIVLSHNIDPTVRLSDCPTVRLSTMPLWIQPLFGDPIEIPFSPPNVQWKRVYHYLHSHHFPEKRIHQLRLFRGDSPDLSGVIEGDMLRLLVTDLMVERWVSEYSVSSKEDGYQYHYSTLTWLDARWGDPYQTPSIQYRTPLTLHLVVRERDKEMDFQVNMNLMKERYGGRRKESDQERIWYSTLHDACLVFRESLNQEEGEEVCTESTIEHVIHLWGLYHGTQQHLIDQGRYDD